MPVSPLKKWSRAGVLTGALLALALLPVQAHNVKLDTVEPDVLERYLTLELHAMYEARQHNPNPLDPAQSYPLNVLRDEILYALSDEDDDDDDEGENFIDMEELDAEMAEAGTDLATEVDKALGVAGRRASSQVLRLVNAAFADIDIAQSNRGVKASVAERAVKDILIRDIYCCKKR